MSVTYALTDLGQSFMVPAQQMIAWAGEAYASIAAARQQYDSEKTTELT